MKLWHGCISLLCSSISFWFFQTFRSSSDQSDCASKYLLNETFPMLETYVASLAGGPVGPSDMIGTADIPLLMATW